MSVQQTSKQLVMDVGADGSAVVSRKVVAPAFTAEKKARCDVKFVKWLVRKNRALTISKKDAELKEFIDEVSDGAYNLPCREVTLKIVDQLQAWGDERITQ